MKKFEARQWWNISCGLLIHSHKPPLNKTNTIILEMSEKDKLHVFFKTMSLLVYKKMS